MKRSPIALPLLLAVSCVGVGYLVLRTHRTGADLAVSRIDAEDDALVRAVEQRIESREGADRWGLKIDGSTVTFDERAGLVVRRDAGGKLEWSARVEEDVRSWWWPSLLTDGRHIYVKHQFKGVTALDPATGQVDWHSPVSNECFTLTEGRLLLADGRQVVALDAASGTEVFRLSLPAEEGFRPVAIEKAAGLFLVQTHESPGGKGDAFLIDLSGTIRHRLPRQVVAVVPAGSDRLLLTSADVRRITPDDRTVWVTPFESREWRSKHVGVDAYNVA